MGSMLLCTIRTSSNDALQYVTMWNHSMLSGSYPCQPIGRPPQFEVHVLSQLEECSNATRQASSYVQHAARCQRSAEEDSHDCGLDRSYRRDSEGIHASGSCGQGPGWVQDQEGCPRRVLNCGQRPRSGNPQCKHDRGGSSLPRNE